MGFFYRNDWMQGQVAVVTGGTSGIGLAIGRLLLQGGARVHLVDIREGKKLPGDFHTHVMDVSSRDDMDRLASQVFDLHGRVDILVNNAGVCIGGAFEEISMEQWRQSIDVNLWGVINCTRAFVPHMLKQPEGGRVVNVASAAGLMGIPYIAPYSTTKAAVIAFSHSLAAEFVGTGVSVTTVCPGAVSTGLLDHSGFSLPGDWGPKVEHMLQNRGASPEAAAKRILRAAYKRKRCAFMYGGGLRPLWLLYRYMPWVYGRVVDYLGRLGRSS